MGYKISISYSNYSPPYMKNSLLILVILKLILAINNHRFNNKNLTPNKIKKRIIKQLIEYLLTKICYFSIMLLKSHI